LWLNMVKSISIVQGDIMKNGAERQRRYRAKHRKKLAEACRQWRAKNPEKIAEYRCRHRVEHRKKVAEANRRYAATIVGSLRKRFSGMRSRCDNPNDRGYKYYGGRGIKCKFKDSNEFVDYVVSVLKVDPCGLQVDRIDNNGHYEPGNIRFVTAKVNSSNRRAANEKQG